jgi:dTDP-4-amino-4,6-dideoxygalactose transaminase
LTKEKSAAEHLRRLRDHGQAKRFFPEEVGFNARLDAIHALFLSLKLPGLKSENMRRAEIAGAYLKAIEGNRNIVPLRPSSLRDSAWHAFVVRVKDREKMIRELAREEIGSQVYYPAVLPHLKPFRKYAKGRFPVAEELARTALALPLHPGLKAWEIAKIKAFLQGASSLRGM